MRAGLRSDAIGDVAADGVSGDESQLDPVGARRLVNFLLMSLPNSPLDRPAGIGSCFGNVSARTVRRRVRESGIRDGKTALDERALGFWGSLVAAVL